MQRNRILIVAVVVVVFLVAGGALLFRTVGGGGGSVNVDVNINGARMSPSDITVKQGDHVTMNVTCDKAEEIHLHEYDIKWACEAGKKIGHTFTADKTGEHMIEIEDTSTEIGKLTVNP
jgi:plastocyanin